ncbi:hypothetical protein BU24DRAFT_114449 [Aaosphaeria arxii CBS 175.79]|uniref:Xylanolytic transcriptional activator regulatory domain-containing protein n=1 Tax=Aaosphaeria arxii CBS 175.79 TaxID=1450172 RepID=A0A6A5Y1S6_9PLEO|nr:uncharacterized protein BU24DRAFT_114449 [Aaosphaeria arxii CBS 175.79]KAF2019163.1 hypothetical protein BU24DRAFT_114449 [Aaosphaeria arxii CBS 175.79]
MLPPPSVAPEKQSLADIFLSSLDLQKESDVPKEVAEQLIAIYYNSIETWIPVLGHDLIHETFARIYDGTQHTEDQVTIKIRYRLLLSISLSLMKAQDPRLAVAADTCFRQAIATSASTDLLAYPTTSTLQLLVLMCIYIWINPGSMDIWRMLGHTSRMCLDLAEMHGSDKNESAKSEVLYRTLYTLETYICTAYGRPRQLPVPFSPTDQVTQLADDPSRLLYDLARLQNRFHRDLIENGSVLTVAESKMPSSTDFAWMDSCILDIYSWLETWRACIANQGLTATTTEAIDEPPLLVWGQFQQLKTLLLAKAASDRRGKVLITRQEEYSLCRRLVKAAEALHQQSIGPIQGTLSPGHQPTSIFPLTWTWAHSVFTAGVILIQPSISQVTPEPADQALIQICLGLLNSYEMRSEKSGQGLTHCLQSLQDFHRSVVC